MCNQFQGKEVKVLIFRPVITTPASRTRIDMYGGGEERRVSFNSLLHSINCSCLEEVFRRVLFCNYFDLQFGHDIWSSVTRAQWISFDRSSTVKHTGSSMLESKHF